MTAAAADAAMGLDETHCAPHAPPPAVDSAEMVSFQSVVEMIVALMAVELEETMIKLTLAMVIMMMN